MVHHPSDPVTFTTDEVVTVLFAALIDAEDALPVGHAARQATRAAVALIIDRMFATPDGG